MFQLPCVCNAHKPSFVDFLYTCFALAAEGKMYM